jgi:glutathione S-transferase
MNTPACGAFYLVAIMTSTDITLYSIATPNGVKIGIALEELGLLYKLVPIDISTNKQKEEYVASN